MSNPPETMPLEPSKRGWVVAWFGLPLAFNIYIIAPLGIFDLSQIGIILFFVFIGTPIAVTGLILSIIDKSMIYGQQTLKKIVLEVTFLIAVFGNAIVFASVGTIGA